MPYRLACHCLRAAAALLLLAGAAAATPLPEIRVQADAPAETEDRATYLGTAASATATGLPLKARETPQPVQVLTRSLLDDQDAQAVLDLAALSAGLTASRGQLYARGSALGHWMLDGVGVSFDKNFDLGQSLALYDRVEVVQGATGLMQGLGNSSAAINLVRKLPTAQPRLALQWRTGAWQQRGMMVDVAGPLNAARTLRARWVADAQNQHSFRDQVAQRQRSYYGVVEADLAAQTTLRLGASQQRNHRRDSLSAIPTAPDGGDLGLPRATYLGHDWEYWRQRTNSAFAQLEHGWDNGWQLRADALQLRSRLGYLGTYLTGGTPDAMVQGLGQYAYTQRQTGYALSLRGPWVLAGRSHQLALGLSHRRWNAAGQGWSLPGWRTGLDVAAPQPLPLPQLALLQAQAYQYRQTLAPMQTGAWLAAQWQVAERWQLILGSRWERYRHDALVGDNCCIPESTDRRRDSRISHYAALVWAPDAQHSAYLHSSDIFLPNNERDTAGRVLPATAGRTLGAGVQGQYLNQRLQAGLHLFQTTRRHAPELAYDQKAACPTWPGVPCYRTIDQVRSRGVLVHVQGQITPRWDISASYTLADNRHARDALRQGQRFDPQLPRQQWQLATVYRLPHSPWRVGASLYRQSAIHSTGLDSTTGWPYHIRQGSYTLAGLMAAYQLTAQWQVQVNVRNLFDRRYYQGIEAPTLTRYGAPRSVQAVLGYKY